MNRDDLRWGVVAAAVALLAATGCRAATARRFPPPAAPRAVGTQEAAPATASADPAAPAAPVAAPVDALQAGITLFRQGEYVRAEEALRQAAGPEASAYLAGSLAKQRKYVEAEAPARAALDANPLHEVAVSALGASLVGQRRFDEAIERMTDVIAKKPDLAYAYFWRGQAYYGSRRADRMVADFQTFLKLAPNSPEAPVVRQLLSSLG
jgi:tetratricopeptide (TPR) repeat protein